METSNGELTKALTAVSRAVGSLQPDKRNTQQNYDYISADKILDIVGKEMAKNGLSIIPSVVDDGYEIVTYNQTKTRIDGRVRFVMHICHESGGQMNTPWTGYGSDYSVPDKAIYKAITSGHKYFLMKLFNVGVGNEDSEHSPADETQQITSVVRSKPQPPPPNGNGKASQSRPLTAEALREAMARKTAGDTGKAPSDKQRKYAVSSLAAVTAGDAERHTITDYLFGKESSNDLTSSECSAIIDWADYSDKGGGDWQANPDAITEAKRIIRADAIERGQQELFAD